MLEVAAVKKAFITKKVFTSTRTEILAGVSFNVHPGEIYGLLGPNGSGKTTTFRCVSTIYKQDSGVIKVKGHDTITEGRLVRSVIGFLSSDIILSGYRTPRESLEFFAKINHVPDMEVISRMQELKEVFDLNGFFDKPIEKCSYGQRQKASLAVSLIHDPDVILFDEPTNGLDLFATKSLWDFLCEEKRRGKTILLSTHSIYEAEQICDRIGIILSGRISAEGTPDELMDKYQKKSIGDTFWEIAKRQEK